jgi:outer membrane protein OmpA-like peptidoglycan-associated protein
MLRLILLFFLLSYAAPCSAQYFDTLHIHYDIGVAALQQKDKATLDSLVKKIGNRKMLIYSYADYLGSERPNQHLSDNRANEVKNYLLKKGVSSRRIMECTGLGMVKGSGSPEGDPTFRRTDIFIRKEKKPVAKTSKTHIPKPSKPERTATPTDTRIAQRSKLPEGKITSINLNRLKVNETINLKNIVFIVGTTTIERSSNAELDNLYKVMKEHPKLKIRLEGHVCCCVYPDGFFNDTPTWGLSVERAHVVYKYLINRGISAERLQYEGFGRTRPIRDNERTIEEGRVNRRVEMRILAK